MKNGFAKSGMFGQLVNKGEDLFFLALFVVILVKSIRRVRPVFIWFLGNENEHIECDFIHPGDSLFFVGEQLLILSADVDTELEEVDSFLTD